MLFILWIAKVHIHLAVKAELFPSCLKGQKLQCEQERLTQTQNATEKRVILSVEGSYSSEDTGGSLTTLWQS